MPSSKMHTRVTQRIFVSRPRHAVFNVAIYPFLTTCVPCLTPIPTSAESLSLESL